MYGCQIVESGAGSARGPREEPGPKRGLPRLGGGSESSSAAAPASGGGAPRALINVDMGRATIFMLAMSCCLMAACGGGVAEGRAGGGSPAATASTAAGDSTPGGTVPHGNHNPKF